MQEQRLPGWAFMVVGLLMMGYTRFIEAKQPTAKIAIFFYLGIAFLLFGILREFIPRLKKRSAKEAVGPPRGQRREQEVHAMQRSPHASHQHVMGSQHPSHPYSPTHKQCPRCHRPVYAQSRYCPNCGYQFY